MEKSFKFRIYPNELQENLIQRTFGCTRFVFNHYLAERIRVYEETKETLNYNFCSADMTALKRELLWLKEVDAISLQQSLRNLDSAYQNFFRRVKHGEVAGFPRFKSKRDNYKSYRTNNVSLHAKKIQLPKLGQVPCRISKQVEGRILSATVSQNPSGKYFVSLCVADWEPNKLKKTRKKVGIDLGIKDFAILSNRITIPNPKLLRQSERNLAHLQRSLSRKSKGSKNREKARIKVARMHEKVAN